MCVDSQATCVSNTIVFPMRICSPLCIICLSELSGARCVVDSLNVLNEHRADRFLLHVLLLASKSILASWCPSGTLASRASAAVVDLIGLSPARSSSGRTVSRLAECYPRKLARCLASVIFGSAGCLVASFFKIKKVLVRGLSCALPEWLPPVSAIFHLGDLLFELLYLDVLRLACGCRLLSGHVRHVWFVLQIHTKGCPWSRRRSIPKSIHSSRVRCARESDPLLQDRALDLWLFVKCAVSLFVLQSWLLSDSPAFGHSICLMWVIWGFAVFRTCHQSVRASEPLSGIIGRLSACWYVRASVLRQGICVSVGLSSLSCIQTARFPRRC